MLNWLNDAKRAELLLFYEFWKGLTPWERRLYVGSKICVQVLPADLIRVLPPESRRTVIEVERELGRITSEWRKLFACFLGAVPSDEEFVRKSVCAEYSFIALVRDLTHGGGGFWSLKVHDWRIGRLALDIQKLDRLLPVWLDQYKPDPGSTPKRSRFSLVRK